MKRTYKTSLSSGQQKKLVQVLIFLTVLFLLAIILAPGKGLLFLRNQKVQVASLNAEKQNLLQKNIALREEIKRIKTDVVFLEEVARGQHGLLKKDEIVFDFTPQEKKNK